MSSSFICWIRRSWICPSKATSCSKIWRRSNLQVIADPRAIRKTYKQVVQEFIDEMRKQCHDNTIDYQIISTATPLDQALASYLSWRG